MTPLGFYWNELENNITQDISELQLLIYLTRKKKHIVRIDCATLLDIKYIIYLYNAKL